MRETPKFNLWCKEFYSNGGNATQAAFKAYRTENYHSAGQIGYENLKKLENAGRSYLDSKGIGFGKMLDIAVEKMIESKNPDWWDRVMELTKYKVKDKEEDKNVYVKNIIENWASEVNDK